MTLENPTGKDPFSYNQGKLPTPAPRKSLPPTPQKPTLPAEKSTQKLTKLPKPDFQTDSSQTKPIQKNIPPPNQPPSTPVKPNLSVLNQRPALSTSTDKIKTAGEVHAAPKPVVAARPSKLNLTESKPPPVPPRSTKPLKLNIASLESYPPIPMPRTKRTQPEEVSASSTSERRSIQKFSQYYRGNTFAPQNECRLSNDELHSSYRSRFE